MGQRRNSAFGGRIALRILLGHKRPCRGNIHDGCLFCKMLFQIKGEQVGSRHSDTQDVIKILCAAAGKQPSSADTCIINQSIYTSAFFYNIIRKSLYRRLVPDVTHHGTHIPVFRLQLLFRLPRCSLILVDKNHPVSRPGKGLHDFLTDTHGSAGHCTNLHNASFRRRRPSVFPDISFLCRTAFYLLNCSKSTL